MYTYTSSSYWWPGLWSTIVTAVRKRTIGGLRLAGRRPCSSGPSPPLPRQLVPLLSLFARPGGCHCLGADFNCDMASVADIEALMDDQRNELGSMMKEQFVGLIKE